MIGRDELVQLAVAILVVGIVTMAMHDRHYRRRRDVVRDARLDAIEDALPAETRAKILEARLAAVESILLEDETT